MPIVLKAVPEDEYNAWVEEMKLAQAEEASGADKEWSKDELKAKGEEVYKTTCAVCHQPNGQGVPGTFPALDGGAIANGPAAEHIKLVLGGKNLMPAFGVQLSDVDIAAAITYERNSWSNKAGDVVQPKDVKAAR
jgi:Cytochrome c, mono- and diheme variants